MSSARKQLADDWYPLGLPENIAIADDVYVDSSYGFALFDSAERPGLTVGGASGIYDRAALITGPRGRVSVGAFTVLNGTYLICDERIDIGSHCLLAWGVVITDNWFASQTTPVERRAALVAAAEDPLRHPPHANSPRPVVLEDNVWVGFDAVILPGVTLGKGCIVGCRSVVRNDAPPHAIVAGDPARIIGYVEADDTEDARRSAIENFTLAR
ncbi:MAG: acyltransferase [Gemmatimonadaceae bacterium]